MRKPSVSETVIIGFSLYMVFTMSIDMDWMYRQLEDNPDSMYNMLLDFLNTQANIAIFSGVVAVITISNLFIKHYLIRILVNLIGLVYFTILSASFIFSYPNIGLGLSAIFIVIMIADINRLLDKNTDNQKREIMEDSYKGGDDNDAK